MSGREFWKGETWAIIKAMRATGNRPGVIAGWKADIEAWAENNPRDPNAAAALSWLPHWQVRPFYTADELAPLWPALAIAVGHTTRWPEVPKSAKRIEFELDYAGLPRLGHWPEFSDNFPHSLRRYFIVERIHHWSAATLKEVEREFHAHR
jgi:hypothetical protein